MKELVELLKKKNLTISTIESFTAGLFASELGSISGASKVFKGSLIAYQNDTKLNVLKIKSKTIEDYGVISLECAKEMAINGFELFQSDICVSFTGNAGPHVLESKDVGLWYSYILYKEREIAITFKSHLKRNQCRKEAVKIVSERIIRELLG